MPVYATNAFIDPSYVDPDRLRMNVVDYGKFSPNGMAKRTGSNELLLVSDAVPHKIRWILRNDRGGGFESEDEIPPLEFSIPTDMILTRQP
jgi:hypothetical protein